MEAHDNEGFSKNEGEEKQEEVVQNGKQEIIAWIKNNYCWSMSHSVWYSVK